MPRTAATALLAVLVAALAACSPTVSTASFDPASACTTDGRFAGAYPELEALLPTSYEDQAPATVDSGRNCTAEGLGILRELGVDGVRFAGATWSLGGTTGLTVAVFEGEQLDAPAMLAFYEAGARTARRTEKLQVTDVTVAGSAGKRLDVLGSDGTGQTVIAWPAETPGRVNVLLTADLGDTRTAEALEAFSSR